MHPSFIRSDAAFLEIIGRIDAQHELCVDCEFQTEGHYYPKLCLVQLAFGGELWAIDPHRVNLRVLGPLLEDDSVRKVLHDGRQDLPILARAVGISAFRGVFDTQIAAAFLGYGGSVGYAALVQSVCDVKLDKALQASDWTRELTDAQLEYALDDVRYLSQISTNLRSRLAELGRMAWVIEACQESALRSMRRPEADRLYRKVAGTSKLNELQLGILRELARWRDHVAETINKPVSTIANDLALKTMAMRPPSDLKSLESIRGLGVGRNQPWARQALDAIARGALHPEPKPRPPWTEEQDDQIDGATSLLRIARHIVAVREGIAPELLCESADLRTLAEAQLGFNSEENATTVLGGWRDSVIGDLFRRVLSGELAFRVDAGAPAGVGPVDA